jgi:hypothetical protein
VLAEGGDSLAARGIEHDDLVCLGVGDEESGTVGRQGGVGRIDQLPLAAVDLANLSRTAPRVPSTSIRRSSRSKRIKALRAESVTRILPWASKATANGFCSRS